MKPFRVSAPGSIMLTGEHAVVYGYSAIVCAIDQRVFVTASTLDESRVQIDTDISEPLSGSMDDLPDEGPLRFVCEVIRSYRPRLTNGVHLAIESQIDPTLGLGSSAAVTAACVGALDRISETHAEAGGLHAQGLSVIRKLQGRGSGADLAASIFGGVLSYRLDSPDPSKIGAKVGPLPVWPQLSLRNVGYKTPTSEVLAQVDAARRENPKRINAIFHEMGATADKTIAAAHARNWDVVAETLNHYQDLMRNLGVSDANLDEIVRHAATAMATKISGSGLGDCVLAMGDVPEGFSPVDISFDGLRYHD